MQDEKNVKDGHGLHWKPRINLAADVDADDCNAGSKSVANKGVDGGSTIFCGETFRERGPAFEGVVGNAGTSASARLINCKGVRPGGEGP